MPYKFVILPKADAEYYNALDWYAMQGYDLVEEFAEGVAVSIDVILRNPYSYQESKKGYRQALMDKFPYFIVYSVNEKEEIVTIVSIFHTSRNPTKKFRK